MAMTSSRPYLIRALYDWIVDNGCTPYILVNALHEDVMVPQDYVNQDGQVVLNISPAAIEGFDMSDSGLSFNARFRGVPTDIYAPCAAIMGIYAKENQQGMIFEPEDPEPPKPNGGKPKPSEGELRPSLRVVK